MPDKYRTLFDEVRIGFPREMGFEASIVCLSPMTHDLEFIPQLRSRSPQRKATLIYDFIPWDHPGYFSNSTSLDRYLDQVNVLRKFDMFFPISKYSADRLMAICEPKADTVFVTGVGVSDEFFAASELPANNIKEIASCSDLTEKRFVLFVGGGDPRKNAVLVANLMGVYHARTSRKLVLVIGGHYPHETKRQLTRHYLNNGGFLGGIRFLPQVSDQNLSFLYKASLCTIVASLIEGFSLPVVEALASGSPVLVSDCDAHKELIKTPETIFGSHDLNDAVQKLNDLANLTQVSQLKLLVQQRLGIEAYRCDSVARRFWLPFLQKLDLAPRSAPRLPRERPRISFATPWPPAPSGVATYSFNTVRELAKHAYVEVFTETAVGASGGTLSTIRSIDEPIQRNNYDLSIFVIGNSYFHRPMIRELLDGGGFSIVHDSRMFEYYYFDHSGKGGAEFKAMAEHALRRPVREEDIEKWLTNPRQLPSLFLDDILEASSDTVVHHPGFARELENRYNVRGIYIPFAISDPLDDLALTMDARIRARALLGRSPNIPLIVSFGYVAPVKGPIECIYALSELHDWNLKAELHFVGKVDPNYQTLLEGIARRCGVEQHVFFSNEFVSTEKYRQYLLAADVAIQPRKVGFGQGSGAVAECASVGLVTVANENVADSVEAPDYVLRVPDVLSPTLIAERVLEAYGSGRHLSRVSAARADYIDQHSFDRYAKALIQKLTSCA